MSAIDIFSNQLKKLPKKSNDFNFICAAAYAEYKILLAVAGATLLPITYLQETLQLAINSINDEFYKLIKKNLDDLNGVMKDILKTPIKELTKISSNIGKISKALSENCEYFLSTLPASLFDLFQDLQYGIADITNDLVNLPNNITNSISKSLNEFKDSALKSIMGELYNTILEPILAYQNFLQEHGIPEILSQMYKMEVCMMKSGSCHRPPSDYTEPLSKQPWSKYYRSKYLITNNGQINFNLLGTNINSSRNMHSINKNLMAFIKY